MQPIESWKAGTEREVHLNMYISRLYYACFCAVSALLSAHG